MITANSAVAALNKFETFCMHLSLAIELLKQYFAYQWSSCCDSNLIFLQNICQTYDYIFNLMIYVLLRISVFSFNIANTTCPLELACTPLYTTTRVWYLYGRRGEFPSHCLLTSLPHWSTPHWSHPPKVKGADH